MRKISEKTVLTALVNYKCVGYFGKAIKSLNKTERSRVVDRLISLGYLTDNMQITANGNEVIKENLSLMQY